MSGLWGPAMFGGALLLIFTGYPVAFAIAGTALLFAVLGALGRKTGRFRRLPLAGGWTAARDLPAPEGKTFMRLWSQRRGGRP